MGANAARIHRFSTFSSYRTSVPRLPLSYNRAASRWYARGQVRGQRESDCSEKAAFRVSKSGEERRIKTGTKRFDSKIY